MILVFDSNPDPNRCFIFYFNGCYSNPNSCKPITGLQESMESNIKPVTVKEVQSILHSSETSLQWAAPHLALVQNSLYIRLSEPGAAQAHTLSKASTTLVAHPSESMVFTVRLEPPSSRFFLKVLLLFLQLSQPMTGIEGFKYIKPVTVKEV